MKLVFFTVVLAFLIGMRALAVQPDEVLDDPALEARARALSQELRCVVCQSENIDDSDALIARNLRIVLREQLSAGKSDEEILEFMRARYGDFILMKPRFSGAGVPLWLFGPLIFIAGLGMVVIFIRRSGQVEEIDDAQIDNKKRDL